MEYVKSFRDLEVYKLSRLLSKEILERYFTVGKMLNSMMDKAEKFCKPSEN